MAPPYARPRQVLGIHAGEHWYNYNPEDSKVFWAEASQALASYLRPTNNAGIATRVWGRLKRPLVRYNQIRIRANRQVIDLLKQSRHVLFLCYGNINRSALAEQHLRQLVHRLSRFRRAGSTFPTNVPGSHDELITGCQMISRPGRPGESARNL